MTREVEVGAAASHRGAEKVAAAEETHAATGATCSRAVFLIAQ